MLLNGPALTYHRLVAGAAAAGAQSSSDAQLVAEQLLPALDLPMDSSTEGENDHYAGLDAESEQQNVCNSRPHVGAWHILAPQGRTYRLPG